MLFTLIFQSTLNELQPVHGEEQRYSCGECGDSFSQEQILVAHQRLHNLEQPFCCSICNESFSRKSYLKIHMHIHTGSGRFAVMCVISYSVSRVI
jgi:KRAB domain-containing zinc finger protein